MRKNLITGSLLSKNGFAMNLEADKLMIRKNEVVWVRGIIKMDLPR